MLIATTPADGHVNPMLSVVRCLTGRGHDVRWYTGQAYRDKVAGVGAAHEPMHTACDFGGLSKEPAASASCPSCWPGPTRPNPIMEGTTDGLRQRSLAPAA